MFHTFATFPLHATSRDQLVTTADKALYNAKHSGRNRVCIPAEAETELTDEMFDLSEIVTGANDAQATQSLPLA